MIHKDTRGMVIGSLVGLVIGIVYVLVLYQGSFTPSLYCDAYVKFNARYVLSCFPQIKIPLLFLIGGFFVGLAINMFPFKKK